MMADSFDYAERLQTPVIIMSDLDLGMNEHITKPLTWDENRKYDRGKVLTATQLDELGSWGRYRDVDGDGIPYRTLPGTHPTKGSYFTRGSSHDENAAYSEDSPTYVRIMDRLLRKLETAKHIIPGPQHYPNQSQGEEGIIFFGTSRYAAEEALDILHESGRPMDALRIKSFPFNDEVRTFIDTHKVIYVIEQNRDAQMRSLLVNELDVTPSKLRKILNYDGTPITADLVIQQIGHHSSQSYN